MEFCTNRVSKTGHWSRSCMISNISCIGQYLCSVSKILTIIWSICIAFMNFCQCMCVLKYVNFSHFFLLLLSVPSDSTVLVFLWYLRSWCHIYCCSMMCGLSCYIPCVDSKSTQATQNHKINNHWPTHKNIKYKAKKAGTITTQRIPYLSKYNIRFFH